MPTYKLTLAYEGTAYAGWQIQTNADTIQGNLESAIQRITGYAVRVMGSGRTDSGVHALGQVASFSADSRLDGNEMLRALNGNLPLDIRVLGCQIAKDGFHALRDATGKRYRYHIRDGDLPNLFRRQYSWYVPDHLDEKKMTSAGRFLLGRHDFSSFEAAGAPRATSVRTVSELDVQRRGGEGREEVRLEVHADGFLYNMVRNMVGTLVEVGRGARPAEWVAEVLKARDRQVAGPTAPAHGLFLVHVDYDDV